MAKPEMADFSEIHSRATIEGHQYIQANTCHRVPLAQPVSSWSIFHRLMSLTVFRSQSSETGATILERIDALHEDVLCVRQRIDGQDGEEAAPSAQEVVADGRAMSVSSSRSYCLKRFLDDTESVCSSYEQSRNPSMAVSSLGTGSLSSNGQRKFSSAGIEPEQEVFSTLPTYEDASHDVAIRNDDEKADANESTTFDVFLDAQTTFDVAVPFSYGTLPSISVYERPPEHSLRFVLERDVATSDTVPPLLSLPFSPIAARMILRHLSKTCDTGELTVGSGRNLGKQWLILQMMQLQATTNLTLPKERDLSCYRGCTNVRIEIDRPLRDPTKS